MIFANNLRKNYGTLEVINDTTLKLPNQEVERQPL